MARSVSPGGSAARGCLDTAHGGAQASGVAAYLRIAPLGRPPSRDRREDCMPTNGYLHDVLIRLGLTNLGAQTVEFLILRPVKILLIVVLAIVAGRLAARVTRRFIASLGTRAPIQARSDRAPKRASALASTVAGVA